MHTQKLLLDQSTEWKMVKKIHKPIPWLMVSIFDLYLIIKAIVLCCKPALMIAPQQNHILWVFYFVRQEQANRLDAIVAPVDIVTQK